MNIIEYYYYNGTRLLWMDKKDWKGLQFLTSFYAEVVSAAICLINVYKNNQINVMFYK